MESPLWAHFVKNKKEDSLVQLIKNLPLFKELKNQELSLISKILHTRHYVKNEWVFHEEEAGMGMYIISEGTVEILQESQENNSLAILTPGHAFGEMSLVDDSPRSAGAKCKEDTTLLGFFKPDLLDLIAKKPDLGSKILLNLSSILAQRLRKTNQMISLNTQKPEEE